jgi:hypothetical protein
LKQRLNSRSAISSGVSAISVFHFMITGLWMYLLGGSVIALCVSLFYSSDPSGVSEFVPNLRSYAPGRRIDLRKLPGTYDRRYVRLILNADGSYRAEYSFCRCGVCPIHGTAVGRWWLANTALTLSPTQEAGNTYWIPTELEVFERGESEVMFVDPQSRRDFNRQGVTRGTCFLRTT